MEQIQKTSEIKRKTLISTFSLFFQSGYSAFLGLIANLVVTVLLSPQIFGIYITTLSIMSVLNYFSDIGLAASLVQKKELEESDVKTTFTIQELMILLSISLGFIFTGFVKNFYKLPSPAVTLYHILLVSFFISSLKTIPSIFLERKIQFQRIVFVQITENTVFYLTVIILALLKFGLFSFTVAVFLRAIVGLVLIYILSPWKPKIGISKKSLKNLLSFGLPFQASSFLALFKDDLIILFLGKILGFEALGYIGWAKKWAEAPIRIIMDNISRVLFPVISRLQNDTQKISAVIEKILYYQTLILAPTIFSMAILMEKIVYIIPRYAKWAPALPLFYIFCLASFFSSYSSPFMNLFNALGKVKISFAFMLGWTILVWVFTPIFTALFGYFGFPVVQLLIATSSLFVSWYAKKYIVFRFFPVVYKSIISAFCMGLIMISVMLLFKNPYIAFGVSILFGAGVYYLVLQLVFRINILADLQRFIVQ